MGWSSVLHGEATAGDVEAMRAVAGHLDVAGVRFDVAWSAVMAAADGLRLDDTEPSDYTHVVWVCGPVRGAAVQEMHRRFAHCRRIAVGVSVLDEADPEVTHFDGVVARDSPGRSARRDLSAHVRVELPPVLGVVLAGGQAEYGGRRRHDDVNDAVGEWLGRLDVARIPLDTRVDPRDCRLAGSAEQVEAVLSRVDSLVTTRLHGLVLALKQGVPVVAIDPVAGGGKVTAQAAAWSWPVLGADDVGPDALNAALTWCLSPSGRRAAVAARGSSVDDDQLDQMLDRLKG